MRCLALVFAAGCTYADRQTLDVPVVAGGTGVTAFTTPDGGTVTLTEARVHFSDLRLEEPPGDDLAVALASLWAPVAHAHPGHDYPGAVAGELLGDFDVDLLAADTEIGVAPCYEGAYATGRVTARRAVFIGVHTAGDARPFHIEVDAAQVIAGIGFDVTVDAARPPDAVTLRFDPVAALAQVDWTESDTDGDGLLTVADGAVGNAVRFGVVAPPTWRLNLD